MSKKNADIASTETAMVHKGETDEQLVARMTDPTEMLAPATPEAIQRMFDDADYVAPRFVKIKPGFTLEAFYTGFSVMEMADKTTGEVKEVKCHHFSLGKLQAWTLGAYELDRGLAGVPPDGSMRVTIYRGQDENIPGSPRRVSRYQVVARKAS